jgi:hypothetical protein
MLAGFYLTGGSRDSREWEYWDIEWHKNATQRVHATICLCLTYVESLIRSRFVSVASTADHLAERDGYTASKCAPLIDE